MKVAIVHDYLVNQGGAERVVLALHRMFPDAPIFTGLYDADAAYPAFRNADVRPSSAQRFLKKPEDFRRLAPLMPRAFRRMPIEGFDVVISSSAGFAHGVRPEGACHIVYCHTPARFLWSPRYQRDEVVPAPMRPLAAAAVAWMRRGDRRAAARPHFYLANSEATAERIRALYRREATVVHPPVEVSRLRIGPVTRDEFLIVTRLMSYKGVDVAIKAFNGLGRKLIIVGDGPARPELERIAGPTIEFRGVVSDEELRKLYGRVKGVIVAGEEDFGIVPLEANASGRPVIAFRSGGALETVVDGVTGVTFSPQTSGALAAAVTRSADIDFDPEALRAHAFRFDEAEFARRMHEFVGRAVASCMACARVRRTARRPVLREA
jgi:glycosyltransferase involved in cell wall biosynthesis